MIFDDEKRTSLRRELSDQMCHIPNLLMNKLFTLIALACIAPSTFAQKSAVTGETLAPRPALLGPSKGDLGAIEFTCNPALGNPFKFTALTFDVNFEQVLNIGSQTNGAGAGKITFNPFTITRMIDANTPTLFQMQCAGATFNTVQVHYGKLQLTFKLVAVKTMGFTVDNGNLVEKISMLYGGVFISTNSGVDGKGWDRVKNQLLSDASKN